MHGWDRACAVRHAAVWLTVWRRPAPRCRSVVVEHFVPCGQRASVEISPADKASLGGLSVPTYNPPNRSPTQRRWPRRRSQPASCRHFEQHWAASPSAGGQAWLRTGSPASVHGPTARHCAQDARWTGRTPMPLQGASRHWQQLQVVTVQHGFCGMEPRVVYAG